MHLKYLRYILRHKWFVFQAGLRTGTPLWRLLVHDWSKFLPSEWFPYARYFYGNFPDAKETGRMMIDFGHNPRDFKDVVEAEFGVAWLLHIHRNPHHWQHWILREDSGATIPLRMPEDCVREMVADWAGAGMAIRGEWEVDAWYKRNKDNIVLHHDSRFFAESLVALYFAAAKGAAR